MSAGKRNLAAWTAMSLALLVGGACNVSDGPGGGSGNTSVGTGVGVPACTSAEIIPETRFAPENVPDRRVFKAIAATPAAVLATTGTGIHRSMDGGDTWSFVDAKEVHGQEITALAVLGSEVFATVGAAVYRTSDGGDTWTDVTSAGCGAPTFYAVHGSSLFALGGGRPFRWNAAASTWDALPEADKFFDVIGTDGESIYANVLYDFGVYRLRLDDPEAKWVRVEGLEEWGYSAFTFTPGHSFAASPAGIFRSDDDGSTWAPLPVGQDVSVVSNLLVANGAIFAATNTGLRVSLDQGASWKSAWSGDFEAGFALASDGEHVFAAADGIRRAAGPNDAWTRLHVHADTISWLLATEKAALAVTDNGVLRVSLDQGATWSDVALPSGRLYCRDQPLVVHGKKLFGLDGDALLVSADDGASFQSIPLPDEIAAEWGTMIASIDGALVLGVSTAAGSGCSDAQDATTTLYRSTDEGLTWSAAMNGFPTTFVDCYEKAWTPMITSIVQAGTTLFATSYHDGAFRSVNGGHGWHPITMPEDVGALHHFVAVGDTIFAAAQQGGVMRSTDGGSSWEKAGLPALSVSSFAVVKGTLFAGVGSATAKDDGVYATSDLGVTWARVDPEFNARVSAIAAQGSRLLAGTHDESLWSVPLGCTSN